MCMCASSAMKPSELTEHKRLHHPDRFSPPAVLPRTTRTQPSGYHTSGSYKAKAPFLKKDLNLADTDHSSTSRQFEEADIQGLPSGLPSAEF